MHRVPERLGRVEVLHPDRRAVTERVDGVVVGQARVPEDSAPEADVDRVGLRSDRQADLLRTGPIGDSTVCTRHRRNCPRKCDVPLLQPKHAAGQPHAETAISDR